MWISQLTTCQIKDSSIVGQLATFDDEEERGYAYPKMNQTWVDISIVKVHVHTCIYMHLVHNAGGEASPVPFIHVYISFVVVTYTHACYVVEILPSSS